MSKDSKISVQQNQEEAAFEMIELSIGGIEILARAFQVIDEVCRETEAAPIELPAYPPKALIN